MDGWRLLVPRVGVRKAAVENTFANVRVQALVGPHRLDEGRQAHDDQSARERQKEPGRHER